MKLRLYIPIFLIIFITSCTSERSVCDCHQTILDLKKKKANGTLPKDMSDDEINEKYLKGCEWVKEVNESILKEELKKCA
ncbi:MAG: hypothetical protein ISP70_06820 [Crocinitomicaceae bacterium]|nr:hypothetical protein [Crocinitomicaceae bacterium]